jgi:hypothetical protein
MARGGVRLVGQDRIWRRAGAAGPPGTRKRAMTCGGGGVPGRSADGASEGVVNASPAGARSGGLRRRAGERARSWSRRRRPSRVALALGVCQRVQSGEDPFPCAVDRPHPQPPPRAYRQNPPNRPRARSSWPSRDASGWSARQSGELPSPQVTRRAFVAKAPQVATDLWTQLQIVCTKSPHPSLQTGPDGLD